MSLKFPALCLVSEVALIVLFAVFVRYDEHTDSALWAESTLSNHSNIENEYYFRYPSFQDVHVMIFVGFGFLMTFLKKYGFSSVAFNFLLASLSIQWATLVQGWLANAGHGGDGKIQVGIVSLINADFCTGAVLISFGALLGKTSPVQLLIMTIFEAALFSINEFILLEVLEVKDAGGSMTIHTFGAYFGLTVTRILYRTNLNKSRHREGSVYHSDIFAMIGTVFLWMFWPSFNSAVAETGSPQHRTALNTYYSLAACTLATFAVSSAVNEERKLDMVHVQNAALAGGVAVGTAGEMMLTPSGSMIVGLIAGAISTLGYKYLTPILDSKLKIQDTCGVHNLHGMPGILGALVGVILSALASEDTYGKGLKDVFPAIAHGRTSQTQALYQALALLITLAFAFIGGTVVGYILKLPIWEAPADTKCFDDEPYWELPEEVGVQGEMLTVKTEDPDKLG